MFNGATLHAGQAQVLVETASWDGTLWTREQSREMCLGDTHFAQVSGRCRTATRAASWTSRCRVVAPSRSRPISCWCAVHYRASMVRYRAADPEAAVTLQTNGQLIREGGRRTIAIGSTRSCTQTCLRSTRWTRCTTANRSRLSTANCVLSRKSLAMTSSPSSSRRTISRCPPACFANDQIFSPFDQMLCRLEGHVLLLRLSRGGQSRHCPRR